MALISLHRSLQSSYSQRYRSTPNKQVSPAFKVSGVDDLYPLVVVLIASRFRDLWERLLTSRHVLD